MRLLLDTNRYRDLVERNARVVERFQTASAVFLSVVTLAELRAGFAGGKRRDQNEASLRSLLTVQGVRVLVVDEETTLHYASIHLLQLRQQGAMIPTNDLWVAAQAIQHNLTLDTRDVHFNKVHGLNLVKD